MTEQEISFLIGKECNRGTYPHLHLKGTYRHWVEPATSIIRCFNQDYVPLGWHSSPLQKVVDMWILAHKKGRKKNAS
jgi:hypothetical protein